MMTERILARAFSLERRQLIVAVAGVAFAVFLMVFQGSLLCGFLRAAGAVPSATAAEVWMTPRGLDCFDFSGRIPARYGHLSAGVPGVRSVSRMAVGFASWRRPGGTTQVVEVIGAEPDAGARLPLPRIGPSSLRRHAALVDASARTNLGLAAEPDEIEVNGRRLAVRAHLRGFGSFLGSPYLFTGYEDAEEILGFSALRTGFLGWLVGLALVIPGVSVARGLVAWIWTPLWLPPSLLLVSLAMCGLASLVAARRAVVVDPELVLRE